MKPENSRLSAGLDEILLYRMQTDIPDFPVDSAGIQVFLEDCHGLGSEGENSLLAVFRIR